MPTRPRCVLNACMCFVITLMTIDIDLMTEHMHALTSTPGPARVELEDIRKSPSKW